MNLSTQKEQKKLIVNLVAKANELFPDTPIQEISLFFSFFYAIVLIKDKVDRQSVFNLADYKKEVSVLGIMFSKECDMFTEKCCLVDSTQLQQIYKQLRNIEQNPDESNNTVSWLYQSLKKSLEKAAFEKIGKNQNKIKGKDLLYTTQFFTDEYMVKFLVDSCIEKNQDSIKDIVFVDPALGGGNFLSYAFVALYKWYTLNTKKTPLEIVNTIVHNQLIGYDLDTHLPVIAMLSLYINIAARVGLVPVETASYYSGLSNDLLGFVAKDVKSNEINKLSFQHHLDSVLHSNKRIIYVTNPPFMGKRDMEPILKKELLSSFPICKGDLCFSFMSKLMGMLREQDMLALVSQNGWMNLSTLKDFRGDILDHYFVLSCVDLGSNAFFAINGEKTNIVLAIFTKRKSDKSKFFNLRRFSYLEKVTCLSDDSKMTKVEYSVKQDDFRSNPSYEFSYELVNSFLSLNSLDRYSYFANPMQGSSTGNNEEFVKYAWESGTDGAEWKLVSKGGGYSRWQGLNIFKVKWGENGELINNNPGSAIRNLKEIPFTELVYSDTGTLGLNVRLLLKDQVFIASGPGIRVLEGDKYCHIAFLNSKIATCLLKIKNPKFTISAGYIGKLPVMRDILFSKQISKWSKEAIESKACILKHKLPNVEFEHEEYSAITDLEMYIDDSILSDFANYKKISQNESKINSLIINKYKFNNVQFQLITEMIGCTPTKRVIVPVETIDASISSILNDACMTISQKLEGCIAGSDNALEILSYKYSASVASIYDLILHNVRYLEQVRLMYKIDLIHKLILKVCGIECIQSSQKKVKVTEIMNRLSQDYKYITDSLHITQNVIENIINNIHNKCFYSKPILTI